MNHLSTDISRIDYCVGSHLSPPPFRPQRADFLFPFFPLRFRPCGLPRSLHRSPRSLYVPCFSVFRSVRLLTSFRAASRATFTDRRVFPLSFPPTGPSALAGIAFFFIIIPLQSWTMQLSIKVRMNSMTYVSSFSQSSDRALESPSFALD